MRQKLAWGMAAFLVAVLPNVMARNVTGKLDLTRHNRNTLSSETKAVVGNVRQKILLLGVFRRENSEREFAQNLLSLYANRNHQIRSRIVDPDTEQSLAANSGVGDGSVLVISGNRVEPASSASEYGVSTALWRLVHDEHTRVCATEGHGERRLDDETPAGFSKLKTLLAAYGSSVDVVNILRNGDVPADCRVLLIARPASPFTSAEVDALERYRNAGGRFLVMLDPDSVAPDRLLGSFQLESPAVRITDPERSVEGDPGSIYVDDYPSKNPITEGLPPTVLFDARPIVATEIDKLRPGLWISRLIAPSGQFKIEGKRPGPGEVLLGAAVDDSRIDQTTSVITRTRLVVIGDSDFATNILVDALGSATLVARAVGWLAQAEELARISFHPSDAQRVFLSRSDARVIRWVNYSLAPGSFAALALLLVVRRRLIFRKARSSSGRGR